MTPPKGFPQERDPKPRRTEDAALRTAASEAVNDLIRRLAFWVGFAALTGTASGAWIARSWVDGINGRATVVEARQDSTEVRLRRHIEAESAGVTAMRADVTATRQQVDRLTVLIQERLPHR